MLHKHKGTDGCVLEILSRGPKCQSCGLPIALDGGGTEMDRTTLSIEFCSSCYRDGRFTEPEITVDEMVERTKTRLLAMGVPEPVVEKNLMAVYNLERWRDS